MALVKVENAFKKFGNFNALRGVSIELAESTSYAIQGASGSGKSTLLYLIGGLDTPSSGEVLFQNKKLSQMNDQELAIYRNKNVGFVFQFHFLLPSMNSLQNILLPAEIAGVDKKEIENRVRSLAEKLGVSHCVEKFPYQLSGGEQQRINIIRALSLRPKLLLCDEPTGNLDSANSNKVTNLLIELAKESGSTLVVVTHDQNVASHFSNRILIADGTIQ